MRSGGGKSVHWCGAIVISPFHILTAGHCLRDYNKAAYFIRVGDYDTEVRLFSLAAHSSYNLKEIS